MGIRKDPYQRVWIDSLVLDIENDQVVLRGLGPRNQVAIPELTVDLAVISCVVVIELTRVAVQAANTDYPDKTTRAMDWSKIIFLFCLGTARVDRLMLCELPL
jgi:hypothetical protein